MKVLKVIVDEMPSCCAMCDYFNDELGACNLMIEEIDIKIYQQSKPDWCPLVTREDIWWDVETGNDNKWDGDK